MPIAYTRTVAVALCAALACSAFARADLLTYNAAVASGNADTMADWLADIGIEEGEVEFFEDFEAGFENQQNVSGVSGLFGGGLVITDSSDDAEAVVSTGSIGGSDPVGAYALTHNEEPWLELDFSARPVDYVAFLDIDQAGTDGVVHFVGGDMQSIGYETTGTGGDSAEFYGLFRNDRPAIARVQLDASGDGTWGIDNLRYGVVPEPAVLSLLAAGAWTALRRRRR